MNSDANKFNNFSNEKTAEIHLNDIRYLKLSNIIIDLDKNTVYNPEYNFTQKILTKNFDELKGQWVFEVDFRKESGSVWQKYKLKLDDKGNTIYLEESERLEGKKILFFVNTTQQIFNSYHLVNIVLEENL